MLVMMGDRRGCVRVFVLMIIRMPGAVVVMIVFVRVRIVTVLFGRELGRRYAGAQHAAGRHGRTFNRQAPKRASQLFERQPGVEQRSEHHIARRAIETIEVQNTGHSCVFALCSLPFALCLLPSELCSLPPCQGASAIVYPLHES
jgi:hypothetical protein